MTNVNTRFYYIHQNNSGGDFIENDTVGINLVIQANSYEEANKKYLELTKEYSAYCECCGPRWYGIEEDSTIKFEEDELMLSPMEEVSVVIHYLDGTIEKRVYPKDDTFWDRLKLVFGK